MTQTEITAEVFKIIRANEKASAKQVMILIKEHLPDVPNEMIGRALLHLYKKVE